MPHLPLLITWVGECAKRFAGYKFRRQTPIGRYIADFVCLHARLIVELDGSQHHTQQEHDAVRDAWLRSPLSPTPPPRGGEGL
jgi:very-short-patch-repair endonuclease